MCEYVLFECFTHCYSDAHESFIMAPHTVSQLFEDLVTSIDNHNACAFVKAENTKGGAPSSNGWWLVFRDMFNPALGVARQFKTPESSDRVSNFKGKIVNQIWPQFIESIKDKPSNELSMVERTCKEHIRRYKKEVQGARLAKKARAAQQRNFERVEASLGAAPPTHGTGPNTSLFLEPVPGSSRPQAQGASFVVPPTTTPHAGASTGLGGYPPTPGTVPPQSPFDSLALQFMSGIGGMFAAVNPGHDETPSRVTPVPPSKKPKITHVELTRDNHSTIVGVRNLEETLKSLKHRCATKPTDMVFKFPRAEQEQLKEELAAGTKCWQVTVAGEITLDWDELKNVSIMDTLELLSERASHCNPIPFQFRIVEANAANASGLDDKADYATLDSD
jgi:hypothetical protein